MENEFDEIEPLLLIFSNPAVNSLLRQGEESAHVFNPKQIKCVKAKVLKVTLEESKEIFRCIFRYLHRDHIRQGRRKKESCR